MSYTCQICYDDDIKQSIQCPFCLSDMCKDCAMGYFESCFADNKIPKCINTNGKCDFIFTTSIFKKYKLKEILKEFDKVIINNEKQISDTILTEMETEKKVKSMKLDMEKRKKEFESKVPVGMREITSMLSKGVFTRKAKQNEKELRNNAETQAFIECPKTICNGYINVKTNVCSLCGATMCDKCMKIKEVGHLCKKEDLDSLAEINKDSQKCPKCKIPIQRKFGCNQMWCTNCRTYFNYDTGQALSNASNPEANANRFGKKATQAKKHKKPDLDANKVKNTKLEFLNLFNEIYEVLPKLKSDRVETLKLKWQKEMIDKEQYEKKLQKEFETDFVSKEYIKILLDLAEHLFKHVNDNSYNIDEIVKKYNQKKEECNKIFKINIKLP